MHQEGRATLLVPAARIAESCPGLVFMISVVEQESERIRKEMEKFHVSTPPQLTTATTPSAEAEGPLPPPQHESSATQESDAAEAVEESRHHDPSSATEGMSYDLAAGGMCHSASNAPLNLVYCICRGLLRCGAGAKHVHRGVSTGPRAAFIHRQ